MDNENNQSDRKGIVDSLGKFSRSTVDAATSAVESTDKVFAATGNIAEAVGKTTKSLATGIGDAADTAAAAAETAKAASSLTTSTARGFGNAIDISGKLAGAAASDELLYFIRKATEATGKPLIDSLKFIGFFTDSVLNYFNRRRDKSKERYKMNQDKQNEINEEIDNYNEILSIDPKSKSEKLKDNPELEILVEKYKPFEYEIKDIMIVFQNRLANNPKIKHLFGIKNALFCVNRIIDSKYSIDEKKQKLIELKKRYSNPTFFDKLFGRKWKMHCPEIGEAHPILEDTEKDGDGDNLGAVGYDFISKDVDGGSVLKGNISQKGSNNNVVSRKSGGRYKKRKTNRKSKRTKNTRKTNKKSINKNKRKNIKTKNNKGRNSTKLNKYKTKKSK